MNIALPKTIEEWTEKKRQFMKLLQRTEDPKMAQDYENAINFCDRGVIGIHKREALQKRIKQVKTKARRRVKKAVAVISFTIIAVILSIVLFGCHTVNGVGRDLSAWSSPYIEHQEK